MADEEIKIKVTGDTKDIDKKLKTTDTKVGRLTASAKRFGGALKSGLAVAAVGFGVVVGAVGKAVAAYRVQELAVNELNQALKTQGIYTKELSQEYQDNASALQNMTTFGDEAIIASQARLQAYLGEQKITKDLTLSILNFASANKMDLASAADLVGKSIGSSTNALTRYGIEMQSGLSKSEKMASITETLNKKYAGSAEASAKGAGSLVQLNNQVGDVVESIGKALTPAVVALGKQISLVVKYWQDFFDSMNEDADPASVENIEENLLKVRKELWAANLLSGKFERNIKKFGEGNWFQKLIGATDRLKNGYGEANAEVGRLIIEQKRLQALLDTPEGNSVSGDDAAKIAALRAYEDEKIAVNSEYTDLSLEQLQIKADSELQIDFDKKIALLEGEGKFETALGLLKKKAAKEEEKRAKKKVLLTTATAKAERDIMMNSVALLSELLGKESKAAFIIQKAAALTSIIIDTQVGMVKANAVDPTGLLATKTLIAGGLAGATVAAQAIKGYETGGMVTGSGDVPIIAHNREIVAPSKNYNELIESVARQRGFTKDDDVGGNNQVDISLTMSENLINFIEVELNQRKALGTGV